MFKAILSAIVSLPQVLSLLKELAVFIKNTFGDNPKKILAESGEAFKKLNGAKTSEEKIEAAKAINKLIRR